MTLAYRDHYQVSDGWARAIIKREKAKVATMKTYALVGWIVLGMISVTGPMYSQGNIQAIEKYVTAWNKAGRFNGCVLLAEMDNVLFKKGFGYADIEHGIPNRPDAKFNIGSISKQFTTALVFQLIGQR